MAEFPGSSPPTNLGQNFSPSGDKSATYDWKLNCIYGLAIFHPSVYSHALLSISAMLSFPGQNVL